MSIEKLILLALIASVTIFIGLPFGRMERLSARAQAVLAAIAVGILVFLFYDVLDHALAPITSAVAPVGGGHVNAGRAAGMGLVLALGLAISVAFMWGFDQRQVRRVRSRAAIDSNGRDSSDSSLVSVVAEVAIPAPTVGVTPADRSLAIATGIGVHNFGEGLAIGQASRIGAITLATVLVIGFALHNATEGFGILAPFMGKPDKPSWGFLGMAGLIGGGPTFVGSLVGRAFTSDLVSVGVLALAAGSILYVVLQLVGVLFRDVSQRNCLMIGVPIGLILGIATDLVVTAGGA